MNGLMLWSLLDNITGSIGKFLYRSFGALFCLVIDWIQDIFRSLAGLEPIKIGGVTHGVEDGDKYDIVFYLLQTDIVQDIFFSMVTFSLILMFLMTGLAIIRNSYQEKPKPIGDIVMNVFKGLLGMILIPIACLAGLMFGNVILQAVDAGTTFNGATKASSNLFLSAAYDANICRAESHTWGDTNRLRQERFEKLIFNTNFDDYLESLGESELLTSGKEGLCDAEDWERLADYIDEAFVSGNIVFDFGIDETLTPYDQWQVDVCYNLFDINYIIFVVGGCLMIGFLFKMCFGMISRIFKLTFDFVLIPVVMAMMPFDGGKAAGSWKGDFVKNTVVAYSTVGALNLYYSILPIVNKIEFTWGNISVLFDSVLKLVLCIVGLFSANSIISSVGGWFQTGDLLAEGKNVFSTYKDGLKKVTDSVGKVTKTTGKFIGAGMAGAKDKTGFGKVTGFLGGGLAGTAGAALNKAAEGGVINSYFQGLAEGEKNIKDQQSAGGALTNVHSASYNKDRQLHAAILQAAKDQEKVITETNISGQEQIDSTYESAFGQAARKGAEARKTEAAIQRAKTTSEALSRFNTAQSNLTGVETLLDQYGVSVSDPTYANEYAEYLKSGTIGANLAAKIAAKPEIEDALIKAKETNKAIKDSTLNALKAYMAHLGSDAKVRWGNLQATGFTFDEIEQRVNHGDFKIQTIREAIENKTIQFAVGGSTTFAALGSPGFDEFTAVSEGVSNNAKLLEVEYKNNIEYARQYRLNGDSALTGLSSSRQDTIKKIAQEMKFENK